MLRILRDATRHLMYLKLCALVNGKKCFLKRVMDFNIVCSFLKQLRLLCTYSLDTMKLLIRLRGILFLCSRIKPLINGISLQGVIQVCSRHAFLDKP